MWLQAAGIALVGWSDGTTGFACGQLLLGVGTALAYPALLAAVGDGAEASWRAGAVGVYRLWRDLGYAAGAVVSGLAADALGIRPAIWIVGALTFASGIIVAAPDEQRTAPRRLRSGPGAMSTGRERIARRATARRPCALPTTRGSTRSDV